MITNVDHIGIAVRSIEEVLLYYEKALGLTCEKIELVDAQNVKTAFLKVGDLHLELLEATSPESPIAKFIEKNGEGVHHIAFHVDDIHSQLKKASAEGIRLINEVPFEGAKEKLVAFLHPKSTHGVLTEFCSQKD